MKGCLFVGAITTRAFEKLSWLLRGREMFSQGEEQLLIVRFLVINVSYKEMPGITCEKRPGIERRVQSKPGL